MEKLLHGDCLLHIKNIPDNSIDLILTDPPYGDNTGYGYSKRTIANNEHPLVGLAMLHASFSKLKNNRVVFFFLGARHSAFIEHFVRTYTKYTLKGFLVWDKVHMGMGHGFRNQYEMIAVLTKGKPQYRFNNVPNVLSFKRIPTPEHPHKKPVPLLELLIEQTTSPGDIVLDPFMGSGQTGVACRNLHRQFIGIELDDRYVDIAREQIGATGNKAA